MARTFGLGNLCAASSTTNGSVAQILPSIRTSPASGEASFGHKVPVDGHDPE